MIKRPLTLLLSGVFSLAAFHSAPAATNLVGVSVPWIEGQSGALATQTDGDTVPGNTGWNSYIRATGGSFVNGGDGPPTRFSLGLTPGIYNFEVVLQHTSWVDDSPNNPGSYLNLFFNDDRVNPGISAKLSGGNTGDLQALTTSDLALVVNDDKGMSAPAGSLVFSDNEHIVTMTDFSMSLIGDEVKAFEAFPGEGADSQLNFSLNVSVIPEPSVSLLALLGAGLFFRRRR
jgi:hypothetical protein